jgi:hypothetical protein
MAFSVFVSYSTRDLQTANALKSHIEHVGASAFIAEYSLAPGSPLSPDILQAIKNCDLFLLLWSSNAKTSEWVPQEIGAAKASGKAIMPVVLHAGLSLPGFINDLKYLPLYKDTQTAVDWLRGHIFSKVEAKKQSDALVALGVSAAIIFILTRGK